MGPVRFSHAAQRRVSSMTEVAQAAQRRICGVSKPRSSVSSLLTASHAARRRGGGPGAEGAWGGRGLGRTRKGPGAEGSLSMGR